MAYDKLANSHNFEMVDQEKRLGGIYGNYRNEAEALNKKTGYPVGTNDIQVEQDRQLCMFDDPYTESDTQLLPAPIEPKRAMSPTPKNKSKTGSNRQHIHIEDNNLSASGDYTQNRPRSILKNKTSGNRRNIKPYQKGQEVVDYTVSIEMQKRKLIQMEIERARRRAAKGEANKVRAPAEAGSEFSECRGIFDEEQIR